jgi:hypothetical protein
MKKQYFSPYERSFKLDQRVDKVGVKLSDFRHCKEKHTSRFTSILHKTTTE